VEALNAAFDVAGLAAKAAMETTVVPHLGGPVAHKMSTGASNEAGGATIWAGKTAPIVFVGVVLIGGRNRVCW
jgi:hypothetical protein